MLHVQRISDRARIVALDVSESRSRSWCRSDAANNGRVLDGLAERVGIEEMRW